MTGSDSTISAFESKVASLISSGVAGGATVNTLDGDQHTEPAVCQTDVTDNGAQYHVAIYSTNAAVTSATCSAIASSTAP